MGTGINDLDDIIDSGKNVAADVKIKWKMKLVGVGVIGIGVLFLKVVNDAAANKVAIGIIVIGVLMVLGTKGIKWVLNQAISAAKSAPDTKI